MRGGGPERGSERGRGGDLVDFRRPAFVTLRVDSLEAAIEAWQGRLGVPIKLLGAGFAELQTETFLLTLEERTDAPDAAGSAAATLGFEVDSVDETARELESLGFERDRSADAQGRGQRARFRMPGGVALELIGA